MTVAPESHRDATVDPPDLSPDADCKASMAATTPSGVNQSVAARPTRVGRMR